MRNVIDAKHRFLFSQPSRSKACVQSLASLLKGIQIPQADRPVMAQRAGEISARLNPDSPLEGAKRLFQTAGWLDIWQKRKRLIRLPGEEQSAHMQYGAYAASGSTWAALALAAAQNFAPHAQGQALLREQDRTLRKMLLGTSLLPQEFTLPQEAARATDLIAEFASAIAKRIERDTKLQDLWEVLRISPFTKREVVHQADGFLTNSESARFDFTNQTEGVLNYAGWSLPILRIGVMRRQLQGSILVPPPDLVDAFLEPDDCDGLSSDCGPNEQRIIEWLSEGNVDKEFDSTASCGWLTMPIETTRSVYLEACPRANGEIGLWMKVNEPHTDNFIPVIPDVDLVDLAYRRAPHSLPIYGEPFQIEELDWTMGTGELGVLEWPSWCGEYVKNSELVWGKIIGVRDTGYLITHDHAGEDRLSPWTAEPPNWFGLQPPSYDNFDGFAPDGVGGWLDDSGNEELKSAMFMNPPGTKFHALIEQELDSEVPCHPNTIADALLRNLDCTDGRIDQLLIRQANALVESGMTFHQHRLDQYRSKISKLYD